MDPVWQTEFGARHTALLLDSHRRLTGRELLPPAIDGRDAARMLYEAAFVVVSHGTEADPVLNYGNAAALALWEMSWEELTRTPSRFTAEEPNREERARLLAQVSAHGFIDDYSGIRISKSGRRFRIGRATVWNLADDAGVRRGQAATFDRWEWL
ncbi:MAG: MEKHLA domain-containing protein [Verrucomicrobia bacterium]|nr:MAG: MEKHLA domain-containing protein [Verrucomicrobiota bacterium]